MLSRVGVGRGRAQRQVYPVYRCYPVEGGGAGVRRHPLDSVQALDLPVPLLGQKGGGVCQLWRKGIFSTDEILGEIVVTPKAADEGKRMAQRGTCRL